MKKYLLLVLVAVTAILAFAETERVLQLFKDDTVISQYSLEDVDYLEIKDVMAPPATVTAVLDGDNVIVNWSPVEGAETYSVYRSSEPDAGYVVVAQNLSASTWTDLSPMNGANYYKVGAFAEGQVSLSSSSSACVIYSAVENESGLYLGITAYNKDLYKCPMQILNEESRSSFNSFIDVLTKDNGTLLYYAEDQALKTLENTAFPKDLTNIALVTFTDGIDIGSGKYAPEYGSNDAFLNSLSERIANDTISDVKLSAYTIGLAGKDVDTPEAKLMFSNILKKLASSEENSYEVANMDEVNAKFQEIAQSLSETSYVQKLTLALPWAYPGTRFRVTFDNVTSATASNLYIEGVYAEKEPSDVGDVIRLKDLVFAGMATSSSSVALGAVQSDNDLYYTFKFDDVVTDSRIPLTISDETTFQYFYEENVNYWYKNSEYISSQGTNTVTEKRSAAVMLVLDSSSSLGDDHEILKSHAKSFISTLLEAQGVEPEEPTTPTLPSSIFSTSPIDLSLAIDKDGVRYYMSADDYKTYKSQLVGYDPVGLCVLSAQGNFILGLSDANNGYVLSWYGMTYLYASSHLPTKQQGITISARFSDINTQLKALGGKALSGDYWVNAEYNTYNGYYFNGSGGDLVYKDKSYSGKVRCVIPLTGEMPKVCPDLRLSIVKNGERKLLSYNEYYYNGIPTGYTAEGVYIKYPNIAGFIVALNNASSDSMTWAAATSLYSSSMPSVAQGRAMSGCWTDLNNMLQGFGGTKLNAPWTKVAYNVYYAYFISSGGNGDPLDYKDKTYSSEVRCVISCGDIE